MNAKLENALTNVETTYGELIEIANGMLKPLFDPINQLVNTINLTINALSIEQIRDYILQLQLKAFEISETKEKAALKAELAETLQKEKANLETMTVAELRDLAKQKEVKGYSTMKKAELLEALK